MAAHESLNHEQLQMFMPARELMNVHAGDSWPILNLDRTPDPEGLKHLKPMSEDKSTYKYKVWKKGADRESIQTTGVEEPISITHIGQFPHKMISDGHHRIATAHDIDPNMEIPVQHRVSKIWDKD
jgi:hypothetical protein